MRNSVTVQCANPNEIRLKVTAEMTIREWDVVLERTESVKYYAPLSDILQSIRKGIDAIQRREDVLFSDKQLTADGSGTPANTVSE